MLKSSVCFVLLGLASGAYLPYGGVMPYALGIGGGFYGQPYYGSGYPMMHGEMYNDASHFSGDGRHYGNLNSNGLLHHSLGSAGAMTNGGGHGYAGGQRYANQQQGLGGYHSTGLAGGLNIGAVGVQQGNGFNNYYGMRDAQLANNMNHIGQGYFGNGNHYAMNHAYMPHAW